MKSSMKNAVATEKNLAVEKYEEKDPQRRNNWTRKYITP